MSQKCIQKPPLYAPLRERNWISQIYIYFALRLLLFPRDIFGMGNASFVYKRDGKTFTSAFRIFCPDKKYVSSPGGLEEIFFIVKLGSGRGKNRLRILEVCLCCSSNSQIFFVTVPVKTSIRFAFLVSVKAHFSSLNEA